MTELIIWRTKITDEGLAELKVLNDFLLLPIDRASKDDQHQLPRLQNEFHRRLGSGKTETIGRVRPIVNLRGQVCGRPGLSPFR